MRKRQKTAIAMMVIVAGLYLNNASWIGAAPSGEISLLSHRGMHQTYHRKELTNQTCTADRIDEPVHEYLENTIAGFEAAVKAGAEIIELDIHSTTDDEFVVFHDWTVDCRTQGEGRTRDHSLSDLRALDIGYGYTADGGKTYPFRGKGYGPMPTLKEVLTALPNTRFMINIKSRSKREAEALLRYIGEAEWQRLSVMGHIDPVSVIAKRRPDVLAVSKQDGKACVKAYVLTGWTGRVPEICHNSLVGVPINYRYLMWGWPDRFERRLQNVGSRSMLVGPLRDGSVGGVDTHDDIDNIPRSYRGIVWTNKIELVGPEIKRRGQSSE